MLIGRLPESWIAPAHLLDLRARVRCRHTLVHQRTEWQQRMHAVLYHHGVPQRRELLTLENREWLAALKLPAAAREQLTIALEMIDAIELQLGPFDLALRAYARKQPGCRTLTDQIYGIGELTVGHDPRRARRHPPVSELPGRGPLRRAGHHRLPIRSTPRPRASLPPRTARAALGAV